METMVPEVGSQLLQGAVIIRAAAHIESFLHLCSCQRSDG